MTLKILTFDQARLCGYCFGIAGEKPQTFLMDIGKTGTPSPEYLWKWGQRIKELIGRYEPDVIGWEVPFFSAKTATSGTRLIKMEALLEVAVYGTRTDYMAVHNSSWKKSFCGNANFNKDTRPYPPILECEQRGIEVDGSTDRADACGVWHHVALKKATAAMRNMDTPLFGRV